MKIINEYLVRKVFDKYVLIPTGKLIDKGEKTIELNETSFFIVSQLINDITMEELKERVYREYEVEKSEQQLVGNEVEKIISELIATNLLES